MRDLLVIGIFGIAIIYSFRSPFIGLLVYYCFSIMALHRYTWGMAYNLPFSQIAAMVTIFASIIHYKKISIPKSLEVYLFFTFWFFITITTFFSLYPDSAWREWQDVGKVFLMISLTFLIVNSQKKITILLLAIIIFVGFVSVKGTIFGIVTAGRYRVWGPPDSYLRDNNFVGVAMVMIIPLCFFMKDLFEKKWVRYGLVIIGISSIVSAALTYSRGALVGLLGMGIYYFYKSKNKVITLIFIGIILLISVNFLPSHWFERMATIKTYEFDSSANQRIDSWIFSYRMAKAHFFGGGFGSFTPQQYLIHAPNPYLNIKTLPDGSLYAHTAHSIYFEVLAQHGFIGFFIFLLLLFSILNSMRRVGRISRNNPELNWSFVISKALSISIIGFMISAAFVSRAFFELFWLIYSVAVCLKLVVIAQIQSENEKLSEGSDQLLVEPDREYQFNESYDPKS
jgi:probable O-glycosylation ligase (exosortase A-associated)